MGSSGAASPRVFFAACRADETQTKRPQKSPILAASQGEILTATHGFLGGGGEEEEGFCPKLNSIVGPTPPSLFSLSFFQLRNHARKCMRCGRKRGLEGSSFLQTCGSGFGGRGDTSTDFSVIWLSDWLSDSIWWWVRHVKKKRERETGE